jgi:hypothetical protein
MDTIELISIWNQMKAHPITGAEKSFPIGCDGMSKSKFEQELDHNIQEIARKINRNNVDGEPSYTFGKLVYYEQKKSSGGTRKIYLPRLKDQLVLKWLHKHLITAAKNKGIILQPKSPLVVVKQFREALTNFENPVVVRTDLVSFFDSIPRERVVDLAITLDLPKEVAAMLKKWSKIIIGRPFWLTGKTKDKEVQGLPQGLSISATLAELWGNEIERKINPHIKVFRFVDDIAFICKSEEEANHFLSVFQTVILEMGLTLSDKKTQIALLKDGIPWLGMTHYPNEVIADQDRLEKWLKRFLFMRKEIAIDFRLNPLKDKKELLDLFYYNVKQELKGKTSSRPQWYSIVKEHGQWKKMDQILHAQFKILHKQLGIPLPKDANLPSIHKHMLSRNKVL